MTLCTMVTRRAEEKVDDNLTHSSHTQPVAFSHGWNACGSQNQHTHTAYWHVGGITHWVVATNLCMHVTSHSWSNDAMFAMNVFVLQCWECLKYDSNKSYTKNYLYSRIRTKCCYRWWEWRSQITIITVTASASRMHLGNCVLPTGQGFQRDC